MRWCCRVSFDAVVELDERRTSSSSDAGPSRASSIAIAAGPRRWNTSRNSVLPTGRRGSGRFCGIVLSSHATQGSSVFVKRQFRLLRVSW